MRRLALLLSLPALLSAAPQTRDVTLQTPDGFTLQGTLTIPEGRGKHPVVILAHQFRSDRAGWAPIVDKLHARDIATLALDLRGHGASTQKGGATVAVSTDFDASAKTVGFDQIPEDLALAAKWVRKQPGINGQRLALAGSSVGATSALLAARSARAVAVLALSPGGDPKALADAADASRAAVLLLAAKDDKAAADAAAAVRPVLGACTRVYEGSEHGFALFKDHSDVMAVFLAEYLTRKNYLPAPKTETAAPTSSATSTVTMESAPAEKVK